MKLIFERSSSGRGCTVLPPCDVPIVSMEKTREKKLHLPEVSENEISRHYTELASQVYGVNKGFYPLGSCTMKYNPKVNDDVASINGFAKIHPLQPEDTVQGCLEVLKIAEEIFSEITGMDAMSFQPAAGAHGEFAGLLLIKAYHESRQDHMRTKIIVPDSAHGTNPASATISGYSVINIPSTKEGLIDLSILREVVGPDTAGLMLTNPNTLGLFDRNIVEITNIVHAAGGLTYYDGANLNAIMGVTKPGDMGFDVIHLNLHKTFSTPHGGGGPGSGPVGCKSLLADFLPGMQVVKDVAYSFYRPEKSIGSMKSYYGNFLVVVRALTYALTLGKEGITAVAYNAVLNANYMMEKIKKYYPVAYPGICMHEFVITLEDMKHEKNVSAMDIAKALLDYGIHPPTMYFPLIVHEALMVEPTETESKENIDEAIRIFIEVFEKARTNPEEMKLYPQNTYIRRPDEVTAARHPVLRYHFKTES